VLRRVFRGKFVAGLRQAFRNTDAQKRAIARFLLALPRLVKLGHEDEKIVPRALRNYWSQYLG
jgi:hypothetical protein